MLRALALLLLVTACGQASTTTADSTTAAADSDTVPASAFIDSSSALRGGASLLPVRIDYLNNDIAFAATITIGSTPLEVVLDTGSSGLRIMEGAIPESDFVVPDTGGRVSASFGSGSVFSGPVATAYVTIAGRVTPSPINVQRVQALSCVATKPNCPSAGADPATHFIKGPAGGTYRAVMGIGMRNAALGVASPIVQLSGAPAYIFASNGPFGTTSAHLTIGPGRILRGVFTPIPLSQTAGPVLPNGVPAYDDRSINVCVNNITYAKTYCLPTLLDSGGGSTTIYVTDGTPRHAMPGGSDVEFDYRASAGSSAALVASFGFEVSATPLVGLDEVNIVPSATGSAWTNTGGITFLNTRVLFDQANGVMGVAAPVW